MHKLFIAARTFLVYAVLLGIIYPFLVMIIGHRLFPYQANGSLLKQQDEIIGSELIAQKFTLPEYFHSRFSAIDYDATTSGGSNLAPSNKKLIELVKKRLGAQSHDIPADMVLDSASGLDPNITLANTAEQLARVAKARKMPIDALKKLIEKYTTDNFIGLWGESRVNVLQLNLALDLSKK